jgi:uncharacterized membrane protein YgcG
VRAWSWAAGIAAVAIVATLGIPAAAVAAPATRALGDSVQALDAAGVPGGVNDFSFDSFDANYVLSQDSSRRSMLHTTETLVAEFPSFDQNRGIIRSIPTDYDGHSTHITVTSVTDADGRPRSYRMGTDGDFTTITIAVPEGHYVHGEQSYVIDYTQTDVTKHFSDTDDDEFYWDVNGDGWPQPFTQVSASVTVAGSLVSKLSGQNSCYQGSHGSTEQCEVTADNGTITAQVDDLGSYEGMTLAIGFAPQTFADAPFNPIEKVLELIPITFLLGFLSDVVAVVGAAVLHNQLWRRRTGAPIIAQYEPPAGVSAMLAANIVGKPKKGMAASIVDLAVRGKLRIIEKPREGFQAAKFGVQQLNVDELLPDEERVMNALFAFTRLSNLTAMFDSLRASIPQLKLVAGGSAGGGDGDPVDANVKWLEKNDVLLGDSVKSLIKSVESNAEAVGLRKARHPAIVTVIGVLAVVGAVLMFITTFTRGGDDGLAIALGVIGANAGAWIAVLVFGLVSGLRPLTSEGSKLYDQLLGLKLYIRLAEADRLKMLQSVSGAEKVSTSDGNQIVKIYERLLPYAVLFGWEKEWSTELAKYYGTTSPDWYSGGNMGAFDVAAFSTGIAAFSAVSVATTSTTTSSSSSSSGGSSGGGSSGGGGGGGGGGGI